MMTTIAEFDRNLLPYFDIVAGTLTITHRGDTVVLWSMYVIIVIVVIIIIIIIAMIIIIFFLLL